MKIRMIVTAALCGALSFGQGTPGASGRHGFGFRTGKVVTGAPYSAEVNNISVKTLADGNTIQRTMTGRVARDSEGRTYSSETMTGLFGQSGPKTVTFISDPVAGYSYTLNPETKTAVRRAARTRTGEREDRVRPENPKDEQVDLGTRLVNGVNAEGKKRTRTIAAGEIGNAQPIVTTSETWYSAELQTMIAAKRTDPQEGASSYSLNNIKRGEPPTSLFQVPAGYTVEVAPSLERRGVN